jgi:hypothetical protein
LESEISSITFIAIETAVDRERTFDQSFRTIVFNDDHNSELVFGGELDAGTEIFKTGSGAFPIIGRTGSYLGSSGEIDLFVDGNDDQIREIKIFAYNIHVKDSL